MGRKGPQNRQRHQQDLYNDSLDSLYKMASKCLVQVRGLCMYIYIYVCELDFSEDSKIERTVMEM